MSLNRPLSSWRWTRMNGRPAAPMQARIGSASPKENKTSGSPPRLRHSRVTIESLPPPTGTQVRRGRSSATGAAGSPPDGKMAAQRDPIPEGELRQALFVELLQEFGGNAIHRKGLADQRSWNKRLIVAHPGHQKYQTKDTIKSYAPLWREVARQKIKTQLFFKSRTAAKPISQRQSRDYRIV